MYPVVENKRDEIAELCRRLGPVDHYLARLAAALGRDPERHVVAAVAACADAGLDWWAQRVGAPQERS